MVGGIVRALGFVAITSLSALVLAGFAPAPPFAADDAPDPPLFAAAIAHFRTGAIGELRVDPRPLRPGADLAALDVEDLAPADESVTRGRAEVLQRLALPSSDVFAEKRSQARAPFTVLVVSTPALVDVVNGVATWRIRVARVTSFSYEVRELWLRRAVRGRMA